MIIMTASRGNSPTPFQALLARGDSMLGRLGDRAGELSRLDRLLQALLPAPLSAHVRVCAMHGDQLVLQADAPAWSTRLRLEQTRLLEQLRARPHLAHLAGLRVIVAAPDMPESRAPRRARVSAAAAETLAQCAEAQTDDALRDSLTRLSRRT